MNSHKPFYYSLALSYSSLIFVPGVLIYLLIFDLCNKELRSLGDSLILVILLWIIEIACLYLR